MQRRTYAGLAWPCFPWYTGGEGRADTEEAAKQQALDAENQYKWENYKDDREYGGETGDYEGDWTSLEQIGEDTGEFLYSGWYIE